MISPSNPSNLAVLKSIVRGVTAQRSGHRVILALLERTADLMAIGLERHMKNVKKWGNYRKSRRKW